MNPRRRPTAPALRSPLRAALAALVLLVCATTQAAPSCKPGLTALDLPDGSHYCGQLQGGKLHGQGTLTRAKGWVYEGAFANGLMQGQGKLTYSNGYVYEGQFQQGEPGGQGRLIDSTGAIIEGRFEGFDTIGPATIRWPMGERFEGPLIDGEPHGQGAWTRADQAVVRGQFDLGDVDGEARIQYPDGSAYTGPARDRQAQGKGTLRRSNGDVYVGNFAADQFDGPGTLTRANGAVQTGYWRAGDYIGAEGDGTLEDTSEVVQRNAEAVLYNQQTLLQRQWDQLQPSGPGAPQMYALLVAGDGRQEVFRREVALVDDLLARRFGTGGHTVRLVNSRSSTGQWPLATAHSVELALQALAQKMNRQRDLLFVFLTSHGSRQHELALGLRGLMLPDLGAERLAALLKASGIRNQIVVVSACYSGGFAPLLQGERTWVITASRADRASFGCADDSDFTYFGRALFKESLPSAPTLSAAFRLAEQRVSEWEQRDAQKQRAGREPEADERSQPQSIVTPAFRAEVDGWFQAHPALTGKL